MARHTHEQQQWWTPVGWRVARLASSSCYTRWCAVWSQSVVRTGILRLKTLDAVECRMSNYICWTRFGWWSADLGTSRPSASAEGAQFLHWLFLLVQAYQCGVCVGIWFLCCFHSRIFLEGLASSCFVGLVLIGSGSLAWNKGCMDSLLSSKDYQWSSLGRACTWFGHLHKTCDDLLDGTLKINYCHPAFACQMPPSALPACF